MPVRPRPEAFPRRPCGHRGVWGIRRDFSRLSPWDGWVAYVLLTRAPVADSGIATASLPLDLHVLGLSLAFILSQDQTLRCCIYLSLFLALSSACIPRAAPSDSLVRLSPLSSSIYCGSLPGFFLDVDSESSHCVRLPCLSSLSSSALPIVSMSMIFPAPSEPCPRCRCLPSPPETRLRISRGAKVLQSYRKFSVPPNFSQDFFRRNSAYGHPSAETSHCNPRFLRFVRVLRYN